MGFGFNVFFLVVRGGGVTRVGGEGSKVSGHGEPTDRHGRRQGRENTGITAAWVSRVPENVFSVIRTLALAFLRTL